jgi:hypothetical protein
MDATVFELFTDAPANAPDFADLCVDKGILPFLR